MRRSLWNAHLCAMLALAACGPTGDGNGAGGDGDGTGQADASTMPGAPDARRGDSEFADARPDASCGVQEEEIEIIDNGDPPDLLIVLDKSSSMGSPINIFDPFGPSLWDVMRDALISITAENADRIRFGLTVYPTEGICGVVPGAEVNVGDGTAGAIAAWLGANEPEDGYTPSHLALQNAKAIYESIPVNPEGRFVLFATDGSPNCGADNSSSSAGQTVDAVEALAAMGVKSYVLGYGAPLGLDLTNLNAAALAGGVPRPGGPPHYYAAENAQDLEQALQQIAGGVITPSCEYALTELPPDPNLVSVTIDGMPVPRSTAHTNGWDYHPDESTITFFGSYCDQLTSGSAGNVRFAFGCPGPVVD